MTIIQRCIPLESPDEWREALKGIKHTFGHTWENCYAMYLTTGLKTYLYCFEKDKIRILCPISEREYKGYIDIVKPYGFSGFIGNGECPDLYDYWMEFVKEKGYVCGYLGLNPIFDYSSLFNSEDIYKYDTVYVLDLKPSIDDLVEHLPKDRRDRLKHWDRMSANLVCEKSILKTFFLENYYDFHRRKNASPVYFFSEETLSFLLSLNNIVLVGSQDAGKVVSVAVLAYTADVGDCLFNVSLPEGKNHAIALVWYRVNFLKSQGVPVINLGGGGGGVGTFKQRFGSKGLPLRCLKQVYRPDIYEMLCRRVDVDPKDMAGYFPPYRKEEFELRKQKYRSE